MQHPFIFTPGRWQGGGVITFSMASDILEFTAEWTVLPRDEDKIFFSQIVKIKEFAEPMRNHFFIDEIKEESFVIHLENQIVGKVSGKGIITEELIAWEFNERQAEFEGFEIYEFKDGLYNMRAEFTAGEGLRSQIKGYIKKTH